MRMMFIFFITFLGTTYVYSKDCLVSILNESEEVMVLQNPLENPVEVYQYLSPHDSTIELALPTERNGTFSVIYAKDEDSKTTCTFAIKMTDGRVEFLVSALGDIHCASQIIHHSQRSLKSQFIIRQRSQTFMSEQ